jgi:DNA polymerase elongation subunit (family B)
MKKPRILYFDIETLPDPKEVYRRLPSIGQWPGRTLKGELGAIISFGYMFEGDKKPRAINAWDFPNWETNRWDDSEVCKAIYALFEEADEIVSHNGKRFDSKFIQTRFMKHRISAPPKVKHVDTIQVLKANRSL